MASNVIPFKESTVPAHIAALFGSGTKNTEYESTSLSVPSMSFRGKIWRILISGEETILTNADGDAVATAEVVMLKGNPNRSKAYYADKKYVEGEDAAPVCASRDGIAPDDGVEQPQCTTCAACPNNVWGSRISEAGKKVKACSDSKRIAIVPAGDLGFTPLKLNVPATSLTDKDNKENEAKGWYALSEYAKMLEQRGVPVEAVVTKIGFDSRTSYPKLLFKAIGYLGEDDAAKVLELRNSDALDDIIGTPSGNVPTKPVVAAEEEFAPEPKKTAPIAEKPKTAKPKPAEKPAAKAPDGDDDEPPTTVVKSAAKTVAPDEEDTPAASESLKSKVADILGGLDIEDEE